MRWTTREDYVAALNQVAQKKKQLDRAQRLLRNVPRVPTGDPLKKLLKRLQETKNFVIIGSWHDCVQDLNCQLVLHPDGRSYIESL